MLLFVTAGGMGIDLENVYACICSARSVVLISCRCDALSLIEESVVGVNREMRLDLASWEFSLIY